MNDFIHGFYLPFKACALVFEVKGLKRYLLLPVLFNTLLYGIIISLTIYFGWDYVKDIDLQVSRWDFWGGFGAWLSGAINWVIEIFRWFIFLAFCFLLFCISYYSFIVVGMVLACPLNDMLSEKAEAAICGKKDLSSIPLRLTVRAALLGMWDSLMIVLRQGVWSLAVLPLIFIPGVGLIPLFLVTAFFTGLGFLDVAMARNYLRNRHKRPVIKGRWWSILGLGIATEFLFFIPFAGLLILPVGVIAGTLLYCETDWDDLLNTNDLEKPRGFIPPEHVDKRLRNGEQ